MSVTTSTRGLRRSQAQSVYMNSGFNYGAAGQNATLIGVRDQLVVEPLDIPRAVTLDQMSINVTSVAGAGGISRLGLYQDNGNGLPSARILEAGTVATDGSTGIKSITINQSVGRGLLWLAYVAQDATGAQCSGLTGVNPLVGMSGASQTIAIGYVHNASVTGSLPATFVPAAFGAAFPRPVVRVA